MATRTTPGRARTTARKTTRAPAKIAKSVRSATPPRAKGKAKPKPKPKTKVKPWTAAEIEEAFRRFHKANPEPRGELQHINPFTLLVAVVLSAQATDAGVNKATPALFRPPTRGRWSARRGQGARLHQDDRAVQR
jgi:endonuclease-3